MRELIAERLPHSNALRAIRQHRGLSQVQLAKLAGVSQSQIDRLEKDGLKGAKSRKLSKAWALRLAPHLSCTPEQLMGFHSFLSGEPILNEPEQRMLAMLARLSSYEAKLLCVSMLEWMIERPKLAAALSEVLRSDFPAEPSQAA